MTVSLEIDLVTARLDVRPEELPALAARLPEAERARAERFRFARERRRFIVARSHLRELLAARLGAEPGAIEFEYGRHGKPALAQRFAESGWRFNVTHSEELALYAFSRAGDIGVDVEAVRAFAEADEIVARFFSHGEREAYRALPAHERPLGFFRCWTRKEALLKALGAGLSAALDRFDVSLPDGAWRLHSFSPLPGFIAAVASRH